MLAFKELRRKGFGTMQQGFNKPKSSIGRLLLTFSIPEYCRKSLRLCKPWQWGPSSCQQQNRYGPQRRDQKPYQNLMIPIQTLTSQQYALSDITFLYH